MPSIFEQKTRDISFTLVVDNFGIKYTNNDNVDHLISTIKNRYPTKLDINPKQ